MAQINFETQTLSNHTKKVLGSINLLNLFKLAGEKVIKKPGRTFDILGNFHPKDILQDVPLISISLVLMLFLALNFITFVKVDFEDAVDIREDSSHMLVQFAGIVETVYLALLTQLIAY